MMKFRRNFLVGKKFRFKSKKTKKIHFVDSEDFDESFEYAGSFRVEILSNNQIFVEGCEKILDYNSDYIKLKLDKISLIIFGIDLKVITFENNEIKIQGKIVSLEFCK